MRDLIRSLEEVTRRRLGDPHEKPKQAPGSTKTLVKLASTFGATAKGVSSVYGASASWRMEGHSAAKARTAVMKALKGLGCRDIKNLKMMGAANLLSTCKDRSGDKIAVTFEQTGQKDYKTGKRVYTAYVAAKSEHTHEWID